MSTTGALIPPWSGRRKVEATAWMRRKGKRERLPCCICHQAINYDLPHTHPQSMSVQHVKPRKHFPQLTWDRSNWAPAHADCNKSAGAGETPGLGVVSASI